MAPPCRRQGNHRAGLPRVLFLEVTPKGAEIRASTSAGLFYGIQTLLQMVGRFWAAGGVAHSHDSRLAALAYRGFMMDFSHGQLLRVSEIERKLTCWPVQGNQYYSIRSQHRVRGLRAGESDAATRATKVRHVIEYAKQAPYRRGALHGALRPHARPVPR